MRNRQEIAKRRSMDPFTYMDEMRNRMLSNFGFGFGMSDPFHDDFFNGRISRNFDSGFANFENMMERNRGNTGNYVCQSYSCKTVMGPDGKPITEKKVKNETSKIGKDGKKITEKNELYDHNGNKVKRVIKERGLGEQKVIVTREIKDNHRNETRDLHNIEETNFESFNNLWSQKAKEEKLYNFHNNYELAEEREAPRMIKAKGKK